MPTLAEITDAKIRHTTDGISFVPTLLGRGRQEQHGHLYWEDPTSRAIRSQSWKAIQPDSEAPWELYDLASDVEEKTNLAAKHADILQRLVALAGKASTPQKAGRVIDPSVGFAGHEAK